MRRRELPASGRDLRFGLADVFGPRARHHEAKLRFGLRLIGLRPLHRQLDVARVEREHELTGLHAIAFLDREREHAPAGIRREPHLGGLDVSGNTQHVARRFGLHAASDREHEQEWHRRI